jgi:DNA polymerase III subunit alpha
MLYPDAAERERQRPRYAERLEFEIVTILKMGFPGYFLIVSDFIKWALANGCPVGPGRGSGAGSLVAYSLFITGLDPLQYNLLFERFLNPERVSMPDFDIDFCQANRERVIDYVKAKYGRDAVSQIATFGTMAAKAALRDVGRVLGMGYGHVDSIAKLVPAPPGKQVTLQRVPDKPDPGVIYARKEAPELEQREAAEEEVAELLSLAMRVEGLVRNVGMHAGGVLIAPGKITDFCPLYQQPGSASAVSQYAKDDVEAIGLVKFDFLGLATLTILEQAKDFIRARRPQHKDFDYDTLPLDDPKVYRLFSEGQTEAVFQFESRGMQGMLREARPTRIEDLIALNAMFRPGPMENIPSFCARKNGKEPIEYPHPLLEQVLSETYGIFVYQEQVMQAAQIMGGYSLGGADLLRRAMGKKKAEEMAQQREIFRAGARPTDIQPEKADEVFDLMEKFAGYGFNKSHAAAYSLLAYHTAWLKVHCTAEFYAANMTVEMDDTDKLKVLLNDARQFGVSFEPPDVNRGVHRFEPVDDKLVRYGLGAIKGTGQGAIEAIVAAREGHGRKEGQGGGPFRSLFDFCARVDRQRINKRVVEALIKAGAFDKLHADRATAGQREPGAGLGRHAGGACRPGRAVRLRRFACGVHARAGAGGRRALGREGAADAGEDGAGLLPVGPPVRAERSRGAAVLPHAHRRPGGLARAAAAGRHRRRAARGQRPARPRHDLQARRPQRGHRGGGQRGADRGPARLMRRGRAADRAGPVKLDRFSGGLRLDVLQVWDLAAARARFGRYLAVAVNGIMRAGADVLRNGRRASCTPSTANWPRAWACACSCKRADAMAELDLGDEARFWPCDEAWRAGAAWPTAARRASSTATAEPRAGHVRNPDHRPGPQWRRGPRRLPGGCAACHRTAAP